ncbi:endolytic transglycosylase MltG [Cohnella pontilimi]|uniref:Endolytic murein transglycosylase n=1 Tax=Cohnella pontilimi TaxID=2564100 RepID=A0A4U0FJ66_9BACL|nr:endolytic transglycosylase MltG [Cohnella pontilimi]TJY43512.1 endolytic transglycosylase MltG [Cohnella pontilimi]
MDRDNGPKTDGWKSVYGNEAITDGSSKPEEPANAGDAGQPDRAGAGEAAAATEPAVWTHGGTDASANRTGSRYGNGGGEGSGESGRQAIYGAAAKRKPRVLLWSFCIALGLVLAVVLGTLLYVWNGLRPVSASEKPVRVTIDKGMRASKVSKLLEDNGLIRNSFLFGVWMKLQDEGSKFQAGVYELTPGMTREQIVAKLNSGDIVAAASVRFTIPEGFTVQQIADRLAKTANVNKESFLQTAADRAKWTGSAWAGQIPADVNLRYPLEGYLFPDTYEVRNGSSEAEIINRLLAELDRKLDQLPEDWQTTLQERGMTVHQMLTIASLVEREVVVDEERAIVSGVIQNRLAKTMPLQIDATIQYLLDKPKEKLSTDDLKVQSPYNTYLNPGLPPGPIATPSLKSIEAALYPAKTDYLYYVTKKDGSNTHLFAVTYAQHQKNIKLSEKNVKK